jgi:phytoene synthase
VIPVRTEALLAAGFREAHRSTRVHAKTFYFASHALPPARRRAAYAVYEFCRAADNALDAGHTGAGEPARRLAALRAELNAVYGADLPPTPRLAALQDTVRRYDIPRRHFDDLLTGVGMDATPAAIGTFDELLEYCYGVASTVGLIMARVLGVRDEQALLHAEDLGTAMQITNILRDVGEDLRMGRRYLPLEDLTSFGYTADMLLRSERNDAFRALMRFEIARAREYYRSGDLGLRAIPDDGSRLCVRLMSDLYAGILDVIERNDFDVFTRRAALSLPAKLGRAGRCVLTPAEGAPAAPGVNLRRRSDHRLTPTPGILR